jgi:hypothetical protein
MPRYNFHCLACKKQFSEALTLAEYEEERSDLSSLRK